jgi:hypothetical protein
VYSRERVQRRIVASDSLVAIGGSRYSVRARYVGAAVVILELLGATRFCTRGSSSRATPPRGGTES